MSWFDDDDLWIALAPTMRGPEALERADVEVDQMVELLGIAPGTRVLDLGSGPGRHALALARRGFHVTCVDRTPSYLTHVAAAARRMGVEVEVVRRDMRDFRRQQAYDAIICVDAIGQFEDEADDARCLANAYSDLVVGGCMLLVADAKEHFVSKPSYKDWRWLRPGVLLLDEVSANDDLERLDRRIAIVEAGRIRKFTTSQRLYAGSEAKRLLHDAGFSAVRLFGALDGQPLSAGPHRLVALAEK